jgi:hypothetical protein
MISKILFLSAAAFVAYRYISKSNQKAKELRDSTRGRQEILPPSVEESARVVERPARPALTGSSAAEPDPGR